MLDPRQRFSVAAADYAAHRPGYPEPLLDWILATAAVPPGGQVADIGCGTGIASRQFARRGLAVVGIEPNPEMRERAARTGGDYRPGEASATGLPDASVDLVVVAQALHWFALPEALAEFARISKPSGACAAFWNRRGHSPFLDAYEQLLRAHSSEYAQVPRPDHTLAQLRAQASVRDLQETRFDNLQWLDRDGLVGRAHSSSYVAHGVHDHAALDRALGLLFEQFAEAGQVPMAYTTNVALWRPA